SDEDTHLGDVADPRTDGVQHPLAHVLILQLIDHPAEETMYQELLRRVAVESARHRVEQLLIPQRAGGRAMSAANDVVGEDLEHRDRIGAGLRREEHVPALLIAPRA